MSWRPEVIADSSGQWTPNGLRFATEEEAKNYADDLGWRWTAVTATRAAPSDEPVNYAYINHELKAVPSDK